MKKHYFVLLIFLISSTLFAQVKLSGTVKDSSAIPLELANVIAVNQVTNTIESYNITNAKGQYNLNLANHTLYKLTVSYIGMKTLQIEISTKEIDIKKDIMLEVDDSALDEVELTYKIPLKIKGDTLIYDADSFKNKSDKKLEDVLKRLPGVEVTKDGIIKVEGKIVKEITVEGKRFFDGSTKLASKNIPAGVLDKIEVLKNHDNIAQLAKFRDNSENVAINIKLKEGKKNFWFGELAAGLGPDERYMLNPNLFYYSPKRSMNFISNFNNIGNAPLTQGDLNRFSTGNRYSSNNGGTSINVGDLNNVNLTLRNDEAELINAKFLAANINYTVNQNWDLTGFAIYSGNRTSTRENISRSFTQSQENINPQEDESILSNGHFKSDEGIFKISSSYKPNSSNQLDYNILSKVSKKDVYKDYFSSILNEIDERNSLNSYNIVQDLNYYYTINEKNIMAFESQYLIQNEDPFYKAEIGESSLFSLADNLGLNQNQSFLNINQNKQAKTNNLKIAINFWHLITRNSTINITLGSLFSKQKFNSDIFQILDNNNLYRPNLTQPGLNNDINYSFSDIHLGFHYRLRTGAFTFSPGFSLHSYRTNNLQLGLNSKLNFIRILPDFNTIVKLKSTESIRFDYKMQTGFTDINKLAEGLVLNNYNSLFLGNKDLENYLSHNLSLYYSNNINMLNKYRRTTISAFVNYNKTIDAIRNIINPEGVLQVATTVNSNFADEGVNANMRFSRAIWKLEFSSSGNFSYYKYNHIFNNAFTTNESFIQSYRFGLRTIFIKEKFPNIEIGFLLKNNNYHQGANKSTFITNSPFLNLDVTFLKEFTLKSDYSFFHFKNKFVNLSKYSNLNANLSYQKTDGQWEYNISSTNILNSKTINQNDTNSFFTSNTTYFIQPRYIIFGIKYKI